MAVLNQMALLAADGEWGNVFGYFITFVVILMFVGALVMVVNCYRRVEQGFALVRNGINGQQVSFTGMIVLPIVHRLEKMDIRVKRIEIYRHGNQGLVCKDNIRADIKVAFFVKVNKTAQDVLQVASLLGCAKASQQDALIEMFDSKFSEGLKTVGKQFDFVELYTSREKFKEQILKAIGRDLNGYVLDDAAIDYLEQTPKELLDMDNILDAEGIKKITDKTAAEAVLTNNIEREKEKTIKKQDVEAREAILELERQQAEAEERQAREIASVTARERAEAEKVQHEERLKSEQARISTEEQVQVSEQNKLRQIIVAEKNKQRTDLVEGERVQKDKQLEATDRERVVTLAVIDKEKAVEVEKKNIQDVIRERVMVERKVVEEQEKIKDTEQFASADRKKRVSITDAEEKAQQQLITEVRAAEASKTAAERQAEQKVIEAEASREAAEKETHAKKMLAEATAAEAAAEGLGAARVIEVTANANEKQGLAEANIQKAKAGALEAEGTAEANVQKAKADALETEGTAEAKVMMLKYQSEADGITQKAEAMKLFDSVGKEHEEFKLRLNKDMEIELAAINVQKSVAEEQAKIVGEALKQARIDIVGGDGEFFDRIVNSVAGGKVVDRYIGNSHVLTDIKQTFFNGDPAYFEKKLSEFVGLFNLETDDVKNISIAALISKMIAMSDTEETRSELELLLEMAQNAGLAGQKASSVKLKPPKKA